MSTAHTLSISITPELSLKTFTVREHVPSLECFRIPLAALQPLAISKNIPSHLLSFPSTDASLQLRFFITHRSTGYPSVSNIAISYEASPTSTYKHCTPSLQLDTPSIPPAIAIAEELTNLIHQFLWRLYWLSYLEKHCSHHGMDVFPKDGKLIIANVATVEAFFSTQTVYATFDSALNRPVANAGLSNTRSTNASFLTPVWEQLLQAHTDYQSSFLNC